MGRGMEHRPGGPGRGGPGHGGHDERHDEDREVFQFLLQNHSAITRRVKDLKNGVETYTESENPEVAAKIKEHVEWMAYRIKETQPIRMRDPLFAELFRHTDKIVMQHEDTEKGVKVVETSEDPYVAKLIQEHARVVSKFVAKGFDEAIKNHAVPGRPVKADAANKPVTPVIKGHGAVVQLPDAPQQPIAGSRILVDITRGHAPGEINSAIEKVAKYLNIYAAAGAKPTPAKFAVVFHGDATLDILHHEGYAEAFGIDKNPNGPLLQKLHRAGVEIYVCGQSLRSKGKTEEAVLVFVDTAVSALTVSVNLQSDGYVCIPLGN